MSETKPFLVFVAGARPNFMKVAPLLEACGNSPFASVLVHTGQHYDYAMSGVFLEQLGIRQPDVHLEIGSATQGVQAGRIMAAFEEYLLGSPARPHGIVVVGDVNSTMACALVAAKLCFPLAHVEAGLRSFDRTMPEEINRIVTDSIADVLFASEPSGVENLRREGVDLRRIHHVGNVMIDTLVAHLDASRSLDMPGRLQLTESRYVVVTLHRPSNVDDAERLHGLARLLENIAREYGVVFPVHPRTAKQLDKHSLRDRLQRAGVLLIEPLGYVEFLSLVERAGVVVSDSGGVQEETTYLGVPCVTLRTTTERPITVSSGTNVLVGSDLDLAMSHVRTAMSRVPGAPPRLFGWDGAAASRILEVLRNEWLR